VLTCAFENEMENEVNKKTERNGVPEFQHES
jgi:hypothetical protein